MDSLSPAKPGTPEPVPAVSTPLTQAVAPASPVVTAPIEPSATGDQSLAAEAVPVTPVTENFDALFPEPAAAIAGPPRWIWWILLVIGSAFLGVAAYGLLNNRVGSLLSSATPTPVASLPATAQPSPTPKVTAIAAPISTPAPSPIPTPSPAASAAAVTKTAVTLRVLNGTTVAGAASKAKASLEAAGFTVQQTGNATNQTYDSTVIYYQSGRSAEAKAVQTALSGYTTSLEQSTLADPSMVLVVIGLK